MQREFHYRWQWDLQASPAELWPLASDTNRFNHDTGVPAVEDRLPPGQALPNARRKLRLYRFGVPVEWEEEPFEWVRPHRFGVVRRYTRGPVAEMRVRAELAPRPEGGTRLVYEVWARPKNLLGLVAIPIQVGVLSARSFARAFRRYAAAVGTPSQAAPLNLSGRTGLMPGAQRRLARLQQQLVADGADPGLVGRLVDTVQSADDLSVLRLRPYRLADEWGQPRRTVLELCLWATRSGLLSFRWELLCPLCRGSRRASASLAGVPANVHCDACNIDFTVNFERSVELTFRPAAAIRATLEGAYCVGGPQVTPHIVAQQLLPPGAERAIHPPLEAGRYRLRAMGLPGGQHLRVAAGGALDARLAASPDGWPAGELVLDLAPELHLHNATSAEQLLILERLAWSDQAATAAEVTSLQAFRDLFASEALRPGERIAVGSLTFLFTDLRESTRLYRESGDAVAFGRVMSHFDVLREAIQAQDGALVKTIGDSVMAVFRRPVAALRAVLDAQERLAAAPGLSPDLCLKAGIHSGPCVAVTLNDRLDYFGSTVNIAARLESLAGGRSGVVVSPAVLGDPEVEDALAAGALAAEPFEAELKGYEGERFQLWAVWRPRAEPAPQPAQP